MQGAQKLRSEAYLHVRCNDEVEAQSRSERDRWTFYETIKIELRISERQGVETDCCPQCQGVWLDRGELDKVLDKTIEWLFYPSDSMLVFSPGIRRDQHN
jgi:hypothetical protein